MNAVSSVLRAIAVELATTAKQNLPKLQEGETVVQEHLKDGVYTRETSFGNCHQFDFQTQKNDDIGKQTKPCG